jgi:cell division protein FtsB
VAGRTSSPSGMSASAQPARTRVDVGRWLGGIRVSGFAAIMLGLVVLGVFVLVPSIGTYAQQQQQVASLRNDVQVTKDQVAELERERERWKDPAYITTQARARLYYVKPGEVVFLVDNDLPAAAQPREQGKVSAKVEQTHTDWMSQLVRSVTATGVSETAASAG